MIIFKNKSIKILEPHENLFKGKSMFGFQWLIKQDFVVQKLGNGILKVIKDRTGELSSTKELLK